MRSNVWVIAQRRPVLDDQRHYLVSRRILMQSTGCCTRPVDIQELTSVARRAPARPNQTGGEFDPVDPSKELPTATS